MRQFLVWLVVLLMVTVLVADARVNRKFAGDWSANDENISPILTVPPDDGKEFQEKAMFPLEARPGRVVLYPTKRAIGYRVIFDLTWSYGVGDIRGPGSAMWWCPKCALSGSIGLPKDHRTDYQLYDVLSYVFHSSAHRGRCEGLRLEFKRR